MVFEQLGGGIHVHLDLLAREEVFHVDRFEVGDAEVRLSVPFLCSGHHHDLEVHLRHPVDGLHVLLDEIHEQGRNDEDLDTVFHHYVGESVVESVYGDAHKMPRLHVCLVVDETGHLIWGVLTAVDVFGEGGPAGSDSEDEGGHSVGPFDRVLVKHLHPNACGPHESDRKQREEDDVGGSEVDKPAG